ncbi:MAG: hypothetical protein M3N46_01535 [Actinomycetota bacterium]|nr:hypothetical protein [Actinomycetota bacterium]
MDEIDAAALFEVYSYSLAASTRSVSVTGTLRTRHGLILRTGVLDRTAGARIVTAGAVRSRRGLGGFDAAFEQLGLTVRPSVVASVSKMIEYPLTRVNRDQPFAWQQWRTTGLLAAAALLALAAGSLPLVVRRIRRRK